MVDPTEDFRRALVHDINTRTESQDPDDERKRLEKQFGEIWNTNEVQKVFQIRGFLAPFVTATHKESGESGTLMFQDRPRFYFLWSPDE